MPNIGSIDCYDGQENFKHYLERLDFYFSANNIGLDYKSNDDTKKRAALEQRKAAFLAIVGKKTYQLLNNLLEPQYAGKADYDVICSKLYDYFVPTVLEVAESFRFHRVVQRDGETMVSYVSRLREAASKCNYGAFLGRSLRDQFVSGVADVETQRKLLEVERDFDACIKIALSVEVASKESVSFKSSAGVNFVKHNKPKNKPDSAEKYKGKRQNKLSDVCSYCHKKNHTAKICFKRIREEKSKGDKPTCYNMFNVSGTAAPLLVNVKIDNKMVTILLCYYSDHGNDMHTHSEHGNEMQPTVNMCNDILCDENGSGSDIDRIYDVVCNNVLDLNKLEEVLEPCPSDTLYTVDHMSPCSGLLSKHKKLFSEGLGKFTKGEAKIIISDSQTPVYAKARPLPYAIKEKVEDELSNMVKQNIISPISHSNWAAPIVPIQKTSGGFRICGDFKVTVNKVCKPDSYPLPRIDDLYAKLSGGTVFSVLDLSMAYQQIPISQESKAYLTINTTKGLFAFNRLPAGISAAPGIFQRLMDTLFAGVPGVCVYLDDILVSGKTKQEHDNNLDLVFSVLWDAGLKLKREKCLLAQDRVTYLGHIIDNKGLHPVKKKVDAIHKAPEPENVSELQSFIGLLCYYNKFLSNLSTVMTPLYVLLRKDTPWKWDKEQSKAFKQCKT